MKIKKNGLSELIKIIAFNLILMVALIGLVFLDKHEVALIGLIVLTILKFSIADLEELNQALNKKLNKLDKGE